MRKLFQFRCQKCQMFVELLVKDPITEAPDCGEHGKMAKVITAPAFNFSNGAGTDMGRSMAIPGFPLPPVS